MEVKKKSIGILMSVIMLFQVLFSFNPIQVYAANPTIRILEITDTGSSNVYTAVQNNSSYILTTMSMKQFVALREDLDGSYDVIYIGTGSYSTKKTSTTNLNHDTKTIMNDITNLKADEIINTFINKGQLVILHNDVFSPNTSEGSASKLYAKFSQYQNSAGRPQNVQVISETRANKIANAIKSIIDGNTAIMSRSPRIDLANVSVPREYTGQYNNPYRPGDTLQFQFTVANFNTLPQSKKLSAYLYFDGDFDKSFKSTEQVASISVDSATKTLSYVLPTGYSGIRSWKLEIVDKSTNLKEYLTGTFLFQDQEVYVKVLQVTRNGTGSSDVSSLKKSNNMNQSYLHKPGFYKIDIDVTDLSSFNNNKSSYPNHSNLNGVYDMIVFGFADSYDNGSISTTSVAKVKDFMDTGQSVMFTHDTVFNENTNWIQFKSYVGKLEYTGMGHGAPNTTRDTSRINQGSINQYPYYLDENIYINTTHNQYHILNLEDQSVVPWYNIKGSNRDIYDSWNHYYTYSKGNITYSGTGHVNTGFPDEEQRLFVNTMYRAYLGSNHAPRITMLEKPDPMTPLANTAPIPIRFRVDDLDLHDNALEVKILVDGQEKYSENVKPGSEVFQTFQNPKPQGGTFDIRIEVKDTRNAVSFEVIPVTVSAPIPSNLQVNRALSQGIAEINQDVDINYTITLPTLNVQPNKSITNIRFTEKYPAGVDVVGYPTGWIKSGSVEQGITLQGTLSNITYVKNNVTNKFEATPITFTTKIRGTNNGQYTLSDATLSYNDLDYMEKTMPFNAIVIMIKTNVRSIDLNKTNVTIAVGYEETLIAQVNPSNASNKAVKWTSSDNDIVTVTEVSGSSGTKVILRTFKPGNATITVTSLDNSSVTNRCTVNVIDTTPPEAPIITKNPEVLTNQDVTVSVQYPEDGIVRKYKIGDTGQWQNYAGPVTVTANTNFYAMCQDASGNESPHALMVIDNIDKTPPEAPTLTASPTSMTNGNVTVRVLYPTDGVVRQYKVGENGIWKTYSTDIIMNTNGVVYAKCQDAAGNWSPVTSLAVTNISILSLVELAGNDGKNLVKIAPFFNKTYAEMNGTTPTKIVNTSGPITQALHDGKATVKVSFTIDDEADRITVGLNDSIDQIIPQFEFKIVDVKKQKPTGMGYEDSFNTDKDKKFTVVSDTDIVMTSTTSKYNAGTYECVLELKVKDVPKSHILSNKTYDLIIDTVRVEKLNPETLLMEVFNHPQDNKKLVIQVVQLPQIL